MTTIFPKKLKLNDSVCVIAPACSAATMDRVIRNKALKVLEKDLGLKIIFSKNAFEKNILSSSSLKSKIEDLHKAFSDKNIRGILCVRGGFNANTLLKYIDWDLIKANPKPLCGFSDITVLSNAIYAKTGVVSYVGPNFTTFGAKDGTEYLVEYFKKCLMKDESFALLPSKTFGERKVPFTKNRGFDVIQEGKGLGILIGGHLSTINLLQGTSYMPSLKNAILFIETDDFGGDQGPIEFERDLQSLLHQKDSDKIKGIVFGRFQKGSVFTVKKLKFILSSKYELKNIPMIANADFGHTQPIATLPIGGTVRIEAKGKKAKIEILEH